MCLISGFVHTWGSQCESFVDIGVAEDKLRKPTVAEVRSEFL